MFVKLTSGMLLNTRYIVFVVTYGKPDEAGMSGQAEILGVQRLFGISLTAEDLVKVKKACLEGADERKD